MTAASVSSLPPTPNDTLDRALARLSARKQAWADLRITDKITFCDELVRRTGELAEEWVRAACRAKGIDDSSQLAGEEWTSGPWALMYGARHYALTLAQIDEHGAPQLKPGSMRVRRTGQVVVEVFPQSGYDALILNGIRGEVWMDPLVSSGSLNANMASWYRERAPKGHVALVLGAGNIASIGPMDVMHKLYAEGQVCMLKMNPVNEYLGPILERAFASFIEAGYVQIVYGGAEVGEYLTTHADVEELHITGSAVTHDAIVFGRGADGAARKQRNEPRNPRRISSELGNVSPVVVVPGPWTAADLRYQAEHIATMKMHNGGFNCIAGQVLVLPAEWEHTDALIAQLREVLASVPNRKAYYPGAEERQRAAMNAHPHAVELDAAAVGTTPRTLVPDLSPDRVDDPAFTTEAFGSVLNITRLPGATASAFLQNAVNFCNDTLWGTLGANVLVHPTTEAQLGGEFEDAIAALRYGCIAINAWTGVGFLLCQTSWGAYPGHTIDDVRSGIGIVHNTMLFDHPQKSVIRQSFYPLPRGLLHGQLAILPKPPWFITNTTAAETSRKLVEFEKDHNPLHLVGLFASALRG